MKLLITGGAGFIGTNFIYRMLADHPDLEIVCFDALTYAGCIRNLDKALDHRLIAAAQPAATFTLDGEPQLRRRPVSDLEAPLEVLAQRLLVHSVFSRCFPLGNPTCLVYRNAVCHPLCWARRRAPGHRSVWGPPVRRRGARRRAPGACRTPRAAGVSATAVSSSPGAIARRPCRRHTQCRFRPAKVGGR